VTSPPEARRARGLAAEERACRHLAENGFTVVARNYRPAGAEIDIVARQGDLIVFAEVRFREADAYGGPEETIDLRKRRRVVAAARRYLSGIPPESWREARFDVIAIGGSGDGAALRHYPGAFDAKGKIL
jgi:putative endonuclease